MSNESALSFDRMRGMLMRAAEIRDSEQQQIFDSLDEIHARLASLDALGTIRKRLVDLPDRAEVSVLAERLDEALAKIDAQESVLAALSRIVETLPDRMERPIERLDGRLDGVAGRMEGVGGRMNGLDDRLGGLHKRLDDLDTRFDRQEVRIEALPASVGGPVRERIDAAERALGQQMEAGNRAADDVARRFLGDGAARLEQRLEQRLETLAGRLDALGDRLERIESGMERRPDQEALSTLLVRANEESERRSAGQLDEAMATFAELILGRGGSLPGPAIPRPNRRRSLTSVPSDPEEPED